MDRVGSLYSNYELNGTIHSLSLPLPRWCAVTYGPMSRPWGHQLFIIPGAELEFGRIRISRGVRLMCTACWMLDGSFVLIFWGISIWMLHLPGSGAINTKMPAVRVLREYQRPEGTRQRADTTRGEESGN